MDVPAAKVTLFNLATTAEECRRPKRNHDDTRWCDEIVAAAATARHICRMLQRNRVVAENIRSRPDFAVTGSWKGSCAFGYGCLETERTRQSRR